MFETFIVIYATDFNWIPLILQGFDPGFNPTTWSWHGGYSVAPPALPPESPPPEFDAAGFAELMGNNFKPSLKSSISAWKTSITGVLYSVVAVFASVGGFLIFCQYMQANDQAQKNFIKFLTGLAIIGLAELIVTFFIPAS